jgi:triacylglycerol lipase
VQRILQGRTFQGSSESSAKGAGPARRATTCDTVATMNVVQLWPTAPPLTPPRLRIVSEWASTSDPGCWPTPPAGAGRPVMLIPGFLAGDTSLTRMAVWLRTGDWTLTRSGITWNVDHSGRVVEALHARLQRAVQDTGRRALIIGQSRGGAIARALAVLHPELIETIVTLGSPLLDQLAVRPRTWPSIVGVAALGTMGVPGLFSLGCVNGDCCAEANDAVLAPFPPGVRFISIYSRNDEVVRWEACLDPAATQIEVSASHIGMGFARPVWSALAAALS